MTGVVEKGMLIQSKGGGFKPDFILKESLVCTTGLSLSPVAFKTGGRHETLARSRADLDLLNGNGPYRGGLRTLTMQQSRYIKVGIQNPNGITCTGTSHAIKDMQELGNLSIQNHRPLLPCQHSLSGPPPVCGTSPPRPAWLLPARAFCRLWI